ncbi:sugar isomerase domain-containing protein [Synoicihabitans lomoniglobus]|uniref:Sugar isomerase domain-containing protein n=1 Tax=Synoicihabitans lomoniglobus TaxID=2909285 RepID=A0AAF0CNF2_9BACT|nr:sugar isomerase domain-containing protein [Opitutaceae bacterium LMO-M01]WED64355.1 sugar isomerase domain-containing protein [Opitutaceae bacterium LMO-M01]
MPSPADSYFDTATAMLQRAREINATTIKTCAGIIGQSIADGGVLHTFGSGHSEIIGREIIGRAGGLMPVSGIFDPGMGFSENVVGYGTRLARRYHNTNGLHVGEVVIVISNSGKNASPIEVALVAQELGLTVIGLTSVAMSSTAKTVHPGGQNLHAVSDHVLDNLGVSGDAIVEIDQGQMAGPTSTLIGTTLLNLLALETMTWLRDHGHELPVVRSQNLPGGMKANIELSKRYRTRLSKLIG